jgi:hypothetical protein
MRLNIMTTRGPSVRPRPSPRPSPRTAKNVARPVPKKLTANNVKRITQKSKPLPKVREPRPVPKKLTANNVKRITQKSKPLPKVREREPRPVPKFSPHSPDFPPPGFISKKVWTENNILALKPRQRKQSKGAKKIEIQARLKILKELENMQAKSNSNSNSNNGLTLIARRRKQEKRREEERAKKSVNLNNINADTFQGMKKMEQEELAKPLEKPLAKPFRAREESLSEKNKEELYKRMVVLGLDSP